MENRVTFPSQQDAGKQLAEKIASANTQPETAPSASQELQKADEAHEQALKNLGQVAAGREVHTDMNGNILSEQDRQELREKGPAVAK